MAMPKNVNLPEKILRIETDDQNYTPIEEIPEEYQHLIIPVSKIFFTSDYDFDMVCQVIRLGIFSIWMHEIYAMEAIKLLPVTCREIVVLHFMAHGSPKAEIADNGAYPLNGKEVNMFKLNARFNEAPMKRGDEMISFHINVLPADLPKLAEIHPDLAQLAKKELMAGSGPLQNRPYKLNLVCNYLIKQFIDCKYIGVAAEKLLYRCCVDLFINFANQDKIAHLPNAYNADEIDNILKKVVEYINTHTDDEFNLAKIAYIFDVNAKALYAGFENTYHITMEAFDRQCKMLYAFHSAVTTKAEAKDIARSIAMRSTAEFIRVFESYFNCSFITVRNAQ
ncbi:MAG: helix-turn-helix transcriptional regulator [Chitinophaga sp.]|uniref:hypothetical protein n=1 Tax=Chitinophaga sp. TaxID=1869181 RepID=UPI001B1EC1D9|nr:hypothetical protein [Chitinophaga sp.]MBO9727324.1 helix-turn-helix transcriptional regulator [Chitinophaga sp.]